jgi:autotransporter-associated beta strand protein
MPIVGNGSVVANSSFFYGRADLTNTGGAGANLSSATSVSINSYTAVPNNAAQPGTGIGRIDAGDDRFSATTSQVGNLIYLVHTVGDGGRAAVRFSVLDATTNTLLQQTTLANANADFIYPSVTANARGDVVIGFTRTDTVQGPSAAILVGTSANLTSWSFGSEQVVFAGGAGHYRGIRWGDYSRTSVDPADPGIFWTSQEFLPNSTASNEWATQATEIIPNIVGLGGRQNEMRWSNAAGGAFATGSNWFTGSPPGAGDHAIYSRPNTNYAVTFPAGTTANDRASVRQGAVTFSIPGGATYSLTNANAATPSLAVAEFQGVASLAVTGGGKLQTVNTLIAGQAGGTGSMTVSGAGTTWVNSGVVWIGGQGTTVGGAGSLSISGLATATVGGLSSPAGGSATVSLNGPGTDIALTISNGLDSTFNGTIDGTWGVAKSGAGKQTFAGANTYAGGTQVTGGTLLLTNTTGSGTGTGPVTVGGTGTVGGSGRIGGAVAVSAGGTLAPGDPAAGAAGVLKVGGAVAFDGSAGTKTFQVQLNGNTPGNGAGRYSQLVIESGGSIDLGSGSTAATLAALLGGGYSPAAADRLGIIDNQNALGGLTGTFNGLPDDAVFTGIAGLSGVEAHVTYNAVFSAGSITALDGGNDVAIYFVPVPEPGAVLLVAAVGGGLAWLRRRRAA